MRRKLVIVFVLLFVAGSGIKGVTATNLQNMSYHLTVETQGHTIEMQVYIHNGVVYREYAGQLWLLEIPDVEAPDEDDALAALEQLGLEHILVGETILDGIPVLHYQVVNTKTEKVFMEQWLGADSSLALQTIVYSPSEEITSISQISNVVLNPDFSEIDFNEAKKSPTITLEEPKNSGGLLPSNPDLHYKDNR